MSGKRNAPKTPREPGERGTGHVPPRLAPPPIDDLSRGELAAMRDAGETIRACHRALEKDGLNVVGEVLRGQGTFFELDHYPRGDVYDRDIHAQYYYHAHRGMPGEHGHFHTFLRAPGIPAGIEPPPYAGAAERPLGDEALTHFVAVSMDVHGSPIGIFAVNRWVTAETWYRADDVIGLLDRFAIDHADPSREVNRWLTAMLRLFRPEIARLLRHRDEVVAAWAASHPGGDVYEDRALEITGMMPLSVERQIARVEAAAAAGP